MVGPQESRLKRQDRLRSFPAKTAVSLANKPGSKECVWFKLPTLFDKELVAKLSANKHSVSSVIGHCATGIHARTERKARTCADTQSVTDTHKDSQLRAFMHAIVVADASVTSRRACTARRLSKRIGFLGIRIDSETEKDADSEYSANRN